MNNLYIAGIGQVPVSEKWDKSLKELAGEAGMAAIQDAALGYPDGIFIGNMMSGSANRQLQLGAIISDWLGHHHKESVAIEAACASGASAFRAALMAVASGEMTTALVIGVEKMTDSPTSETTASLASAADNELEGDFGISFVALNAFLMRRYMHEFGWTTGDFSGFSINAHANAVSNPFARFQKAITRKDFDRAGMVCDPINLMDASPIGDGAAAILITNHRPSTSKHVVKVIASASATDTLSLQHRKNLLKLAAAEKAAMCAYSQAGITPKEIGVFEYHDAFSIMAALCLEACGFCDPGKAPSLAIEGDITFNKKIPVATKGGLKARGHPVGATGIYELVEVTQQLREEAGQTQVLNPKYGLTINIGGSGSNITAHILAQE